LFLSETLDRRVLIVALILGVALIGAAYLETYFWVFLLITVAVVAPFLALKHYAGN